jgi:two-component system, chemotaxis family, sensor kinase CheA
MEPDREALVETFLAECDENLAAMEEGLVRLEKEPGDAEVLHSVFRAAHTLKGNASSFGLEEVARVAHVMEDLLERLRSGRLEADAALVTLLLRGVDALRRQVPAAMRGEKPGNEPGDAGVLADLERFGRPTSGGDDPRASSARPPTAAAPAGGRGGGTRPPGGGGSADVRGRTLRVGIEKLDRLLNLSGELAISRGRLRQILEGGRSPELRQALEVHREADRVHADLQELVMEVRMVSVGPMFRHHARMVRDQAAALGKRVRLVLEGEDVEADTKIVEYMRDPLTHMVRNALDHGIEAPREREAAGKDACGTVTLRARHETGNVVFEVSDDGAGLDRAAILARARQRGLVAAEESLTDDQAFALALEPGFSTAETVTALSGRGVGLDVVRRHVDALRGVLSVESERGRGTTLRACLPLTVAIISGFGVGVGVETYIVPLEWVVETLELPRGAGRRERRDGRGVVSLRGEPLPYVRLRSLFGLEGAVPGREHVVVVSHGGCRAGLAVDLLHGESQTVIKPLGRLLHGLPGIAGSAVLGDGRVALILDVPALLKEVVREAHDGEGLRVERGVPAGGARSGEGAEWRQRCDRLRRSGWRCSSGSP